MQVAGDAVPVVGHVEGAQVLLGLAHLDQVVDPGPQFGLVEGLEQVVVGAPAQHLDARLGVVAGGEDEDGRGVHAGLGPDLAHELVAGHLGHHEVADDDVGMERTGPFDSLPPVVGGGHPVVGAQRVADEVVHVDVVLDDEDEGAVGVVDGAWCPADRR